MNDLKLAFRQLRQIARVHSGRGAHAGAWYRREHRHLQRGQRGVVKATAVSVAGSACCDWQHKSEGPGQIPPVQLAFLSGLLRFPKSKPNLRLHVGLSRWQLRAR